MTRRCSVVLSLALMAAFATAVTVECVESQSTVMTAGRVEPVDESGLDPAFASFWTQFQDVVSHRDLERLRDLIADDIYWSFALEHLPDSHSRDRFLASWQEKGLDGLWFELRRVIDAGGIFERGVDGARHRDSFEFPSSCVRFAVSGSYEAHVIAFREGVRIYAAPMYDSAVLGKVDYAVLRAAPVAGQVSEYWHRVHVGPDTFGFVSAHDVCTPLGYRGRFARTPKGWRLVTFVAGEP